MADKNVFETLYIVNVNDYKEDRNGLSYLSWTDAWSELKKRYPSATYEVVRDQATGLPYVYDPNTGYMVFTKMTIEGITHEMWLPVMDSMKKSMKAEPYNVQTKKGDHTVPAATMFDINTSIMRCLTKNMAMFGLGLYIYAGEDLPESEEDIKNSVLDPIERVKKFVENRADDDKDGVIQYITKRFGIENWEDINDGQAREFITIMQIKGKEI